MTYNKEDRPAAQGVPPLRSRPLAAALLATCLLVTALFVGCTSRQDVIARMQKNFAAANYRAALVDLQNLARQEPGNVDFRLKLAESLLRTGNFPDAEAAFNRARQLGAASSAVLPGLTEALLGERKYQEALDGLNKEGPPGDATYLKLRGRALLGLNRVPEAREAWLAAVDKAPQDPAAHLGLAQTLLRAGDTSGAKAELDKAAEVGPDDFDVHLARGRWFMIQERSAAAARTEFSKALELAQRAGNRANTIAALTLLGEAEAAVPDVAAAQQHLQQLQKLAPKASGTLLLQARLDLQTNKLEEAQATLKELLSREPHNEPASVLLGLIAARSGKPDTAQTYLSQALSDQPGNVAVRTLLAEAQLAQHQPGEALQTATDPRAAGDAALLSLAGRASILEGDVAGGVAYLERSEQAAPSDKSRSLDLAAGYLAARRSADALALLQKLEVPDTLVDRREWLLLRALVDSGHSAEARAEAQRFAQARPNDLTAKLIAAAGLHASQDVPGARALLAEAAALDPHAPQPWIQLGRLEWSQQDVPAAERALTHALELDPKNDAALLDMARVNLAQRDTAAAVQKLEQVRAQAPRALAPRIMLARLYLATGDVSKSAAAHAEAQALAPANSDVRLLGALLALARGDGAAAATTLEDLAKRFPKVSELHADLARAYLLTGRMADAHASAEAALRLDPAYWPALVTEITVSLGQKDQRGAEAALERLKHSAAPQATVLSITGELATRSGKLDEALKAFTAANALTPSGHLALRMYATRRALQIPDPEAPLRDWLQRAPSDVAVRLALAQQLQAEGQSAAAAKEYETILRQAPQQSVALNNLAWLRLESGDAQAGLDLAHRAYDSASGVPAVADTYGWALVQTGRAADAVPLLRNACGKLPGDTEVRYHFGVALVRTGAIQEGRKELQAVADSADKSKASEQARALLAQLDAGGKG